jgi:nucleotide sugar dehydrogenase
MDEIVVLGCGGVGLAFAVALASRGARVLGVDIDPVRVEGLRRGETGLVDEGLSAALRLALSRGNLDFARAASPAGHRRGWVIATPTPVGETSRLDDGPILSAFDAILEAAGAGDLVMVRSTVPVGFTRALAARAPDRGLGFAACPDRTLAGRAFAEQFSAPHVAGGLDQASGEAAEAVLTPLGQVVRVSSPEAAEALKLLANVWRDARFALANQLALFCEAAGLDFAEIRAAGAAGFGRFDLPRAGPVGGPCLTKDVHLLAQSAEHVGGDASLFLAARRINQRLVGHIADAITRDLRGRAGVPRLAVLGLAFKGDPPVSDRRGSFASDLIARLAQDWPYADLRVWDPATSPPEARAPATHDADIVVLANDHAALADPAELEGCAAGALVFDLCGVLTGPVRADLRVRRLGSGRGG